MSIETKLGYEIENRFTDLEKMEAGTEEYTKTVEGLAKLLEKQIEFEKLEAEKNEKIQEHEENRKERWVKNGIAIAGIVIPTAVTIWGTVKSFEFEKEGTITTIMGRGFINKLLPKK